MVMLQGIYHSPSVHVENTNYATIAANNDQVSVIGSRDLERNILFNPKRECTTSFEMWEKIAVNTVVQVGDIYILAIWGEGSITTRQVYYVSNSQDANESLSDSH